MASTPLHELTPENLDKERPPSAESAQKKQTSEELVSIAKPYKPPPALSRSWHALPPRKKRSIVQYFLHHRIHEPGVLDGTKQRQRCLSGLEWNGAWRPPKASEAAAHFQVPERTVRGIWYNRASIMGHKRTGLRDASRVQGEKLPEVETAADGTESDALLVPSRVEGEKLPEVEPETDGTASDPLLVSSESEDDIRDAV